VFHQMGRKAVRVAASAIVLGFLGSLAGCGGSSGSGDATTLPPNNTPTLQSIEVTPSHSQAAAGTKAQFTATGVYTDNTTQDLTTQVTWASSDDAVATVSNATDSEGLATAVGAGSTTVSATSGDASGDTMLTVTDATLVSIEVTPATPSIANGLTQQFTATGLYTDNTTQDLTTQVTWASSDPAVATVSDAAGENGLATAASIGSTNVSATSGGVTGGTTLTVTGATLVSIEMTPSHSQAAAGTKAQFTATGLYTDNTAQDLTTQVTWASSDSTVATVSNAADSEGLATAVGAGSTTVSATSGGVTGDTTLTVTDATLVSIEVSPADPSIADGLTQQFTATGLYTDGSTPDITAEVTWGSSDDAVATVSNATDSEGLATAVGAGSTTVSATSGGVTGDTTLTVIPASPSVDEMLTALLAAVTGVGPGHSLENKVTRVRDDLADHDIVSACSMLDDFNNQVSGLSDEIGVALADQLTADANAIKAAIPCP
jgi:Bacterial Ig-like domain (group 2)